MSAVPWVGQASEAKADNHRGQQALFTAASGICVTGRLRSAYLSRGQLRRRLETSRHACRSADARPEIAAYFAAVLFGARFVVRRHGMRRATCARI